MLIPPNLGSLSIRRSSYDYDVLDELWDDPAKPETHKPHPGDWRQGASELEYIGPKRGWSRTSIVDAADSETEGVYAIRAVESKRVKLGWASNVHRRLKELQCGSPETLEIACVFDLGRESEPIVHGLVHEYRVRGEWFEEEALQVLLQRYPLI